MDERVKLATTIVIWVLVTAILMTLFIAMAATDAFANTDAVIPMSAFVMVLAGVAGYSTRVVWNSGTQQPVSRREHRKMKRSDPHQLERLMEELSEDEIVELETLLLSRDAPYRDERYTE